MVLLRLLIIMSGKLSLKWNDFQSNILKTFTSLRNEDDLFDVTLVSDDQVQVSAHKLALSAASEYFKTIFKMNKHAHILIYLSGLKSEDINNVLEYIYSGEVQIGQNEIGQFLEVAKRFKLEGLTSLNNQVVDDKIECKVSKTKVKNNQEVYDDIEYKVSKTKVENNEVVYDEFECKVSKTEAENNPTNLLLEEDDKSPTNKEPYQSRKKRSDVESLEMVSEYFNSIDELDAIIKTEIVKDNDGMFKCRRCPHISKFASAIQDHVETHIEGISFRCNLCGKTYRTRHSLRNHLKRHQKWTFLEKK